MLSFNKCHKINILPIGWEKSSAKIDHTCLSPTPPVIGVHISILLVCLQWYVNKWRHYLKKTTEKSCVKHSLSFLPWCILWLKTLRNTLENSVHLHDWVIYFWLKNIQIQSFKSEGYCIFCDARSHMQVAQCCWWLWDVDSSLQSL